MRDVHMFDVTEILRLSARLTPLSLTVCRVRAESRHGLHNKREIKIFSLNFSWFCYFSALEREERVGPDWSISNIILSRDNDNDLMIMIIF